MKDSTTMDFTTLYTIMIQQQQASVQAKATAHESIALNNGAVSHLVNGDHGLALQSFQQALAKLLSIREITRNQYIHEEQDEDSVLEDVSHPLTSTALPCHLGSPTEAQSEDIFQFFNRAICLPEHADFVLSLASSGSASSRRNRNRSVATVLYNIALCYQLEGLQSGNAQAFSVALNYYGQAYCTMEKSSKEFGFGDALLLVLALFNNMGHIHNTAHVDSEKTRQCVYWMQSTFRSSASALSREDYNFFFQYVSVASNRQLLIAPAA